MNAAPRPIRKLLVANRGEIALRVLRAAHEAGIRTVAVYSDADRVELHVRAAHEAVRLGPPPPRDSYLHVDALIAAAKATGADAVHPGYGFVSENATFREACDAAGLVFVGPPASAMRRMGDKVSARRTAEGAGVPVVPGAEIPDPTDGPAVVAAARRVGFPLLVKAARGGGGKGIRRVEREADLAEACKRAASEAKTSFGSEVVYLERYVERPRHVEVQVIVDDHGHAVAVGERECSVQRRHQKVIEETPSPVVDDALRAKVCAAGVAVARAVGYRNAGTVELLVGADRSFYFMEMNNRLQVEHPITELRYGVDLVAEQLRVAQGLPLSFGDRAPAPRGHAIEARLCAEDPANGFLPSTGRVTALQLPGGPGVRIDGHLYVGQEITLFYDPMLAKIVVHADTRAAAIARMRRALHETRVGGLTTNVPLLLDVLDDPRFVAGDYDTSLLSGYAPRDPAAPAAHLEGADGEDLAPVVAAALAAHRRTPTTSVPAAAAGPSEPAWVREGRRSLGEWPR
ncbi:MAG: ATP-grasp domain-containing protein [Planctomycetes bacterium]|nr:ATP-grasp domain-containing protein [Planctomycetota bacterium]